MQNWDDNVCMKGNPPKVQENETFPSRTLSIQEQEYAWKQSLYNPNNIKAVHMQLSYSYRRETVSLVFPECFSYCRKSAGVPSHHKLAMEGVKQCKCNQEIAPKHCRDHSFLFVMYYRGNKLLVPLLPLNRLWDNCPIPPHKSVVEHLGDSQINSKLFSFPPLLNEHCSIGKSTLPIRLQSSRKAIDKSQC